MLQPQSRTISTMEATVRRRRWRSSPVSSADGVSGAAKRPGRPAGPPSQVAVQRSAWAMPGDRAGQSGCGGYDLQAAAGPSDCGDRARELVVVVGTTGRSQIPEPPGISPLVGCRPAAGYPRGVPDAIAPINSVAGAVSEVTPARGIAAMTSLRQRVAQAEAARPTRRRQFEVPDRRLAKRIEPVSASLRSRTSRRRKELSDAGIGPVS